MKYFNLYNEAVAEMEKTCGVQPPYPYWCILKWGKIMEEEIPKVYDGIDYDLEQVIVAINSLRKAKDIAEKKLDSVVSIENYDDKQIDEDEENKEIKKATREKYENYKKNANK